MLNALSAVGGEVLGDLGSVVRRLVDRDPDLAAGTRHGLAAQPRHLAFDVEVAHFAKIEEALVELCPLVHPAAVDVVSQVIDVPHPRTDGIRFGALDRYEVDIVDRAALTVAIDQVEEAIANALDGGDIELHGTHVGSHTPRAKLLRPTVGLGGVANAESDRADGRPVHARERLRKTVGLGIDDKVDVTLAIQPDVLRTMPSDRYEAERLEEPTQCRRIGRSVFHKLEAVGAHRIVHHDVLPHPDMLSLAGAWSGN